MKELFAEPGSSDGMMNTIAALRTRVARLEAALNAINRMTSAGNRTLDELCRDMSYANDCARAALKDESQ